MRVLVVNQHPQQALGGSEVQCDLIARGLVERGHDVTYVAVAPPSSPSPIGRTPYHVVEVGAEPSRIVAAVRDLQPDVVYWRFNRRGLRAVARGLRSDGIPLVVALAHVDDVTPWPSWPWPRRDATLRDRVHDLRQRLRWRGELSAFADVTAIASQREDLLDRTPVALRSVVPNLMDPVLEPFSWPRPFVAWVGNLKARKRPELIPRIATALEPHGIDLVVAGPVVDAGAAGWVSATDGPANLHHLGPILPREVSGMLAAATCLAVTARPEGFSNVMIQAWWSGTPTATLDYDPDGVVVGRGLGRCAGGDVEAFLAAVVDLAAGGPDAVEAGRRARAFARERFAPAAALDALEQLLAEAVVSA